MLVRLSASNCFSVTIWEIPIAIAIRAKSLFRRTRFETAANSTSSSMRERPARPDLAPGLAPRQTPGPVRNLVTLNTENLAPGAVLVNNLLIGGNQGGIQISGAGGSTAGGTPPFTVARVINNTIVGGIPNDVGILVNQNASPTLINNILSTIVSASTSEPPRPFRVEISSPPIRSTSSLRRPPAPSTS